MSGNMPELSTVNYAQGLESVYHANLIALHRPLAQRACLSGVLGAAPGALTYLLQPAVGEAEVKGLARYQHARLLIDIIPRPPFHTLNL
jgi:hypothetical protein